MRITNIDYTTKPKAFKPVSNESGINGRENELPKKISGETNFDCNIGNFCQGNSTNCVFLARVKNLSRKSWGKRYIKKCIEPDGNGGVYINYLGTKTDETRFHVTKDDILNVRNKQNKGAYLNRQNKFIPFGEFSSGDDDVLAMEIASERPIYYENDPIKLITGKAPISFRIENQNMANMVLRKANRNIDNYIITISLKDNNFGLRRFHAFGVLGIENDKNNNPMIKLCNPWDTSEEIVMNYYDVVSSMDSLYIAENPEKHMSWFENLCDENSDKKNNESDLKALQHYYKNRTVTAEFSSLKRIINIQDNKERIQKINEYLQNTNHVLINEMLRSKTSDIITLMDNKEYGMKNHQSKKELITTLVDYVSNEAWVKNVDKEIILKFKKECYGELNSIFYVDEKKIIKAFNDIIPELFKLHAPKASDVIQIKLVQK